MQRADDAHAPTSWKCNIMNELDHTRSRAKSRSAMLVNSLALLSHSEVPHGSGHKGHRLRTVGSATSGLRFLFGSMQMRCWKETLVGVTITSGSQKSCSGRSGFGAFTKLVDVERARAGQFMRAASKTLLCGGAERPVTRACIPQVFDCGMEEVGDESRLWSKHSIL